MFEFKTHVKLYDTDAAGVLFFANQFRLVHDAYEAFLESKGLSLGDFLKNSPFSLPVVHAETGYKTPLMTGDKIIIKIMVTDIGETSFALVHEIFKETGEPAGVGKTVHVCIDRKTGIKIPLPQEFVKKIANH